MVWITHIRDTFEVRVRMSRLLDSGHANWSTQPEAPYLLVPIFLRARDNRARRT